MSFLTATNTEVIYNMPATGPDVTVTTAFQYITPTTSNNAAYLPPLFSIWQPSTLPGKGMRFVLRGTSLINGSNTITFNFGTNTTQNNASSFGGATWATSGAMTGTSSASAAAWYAELDVVFDSVAGANVNAYINGSFAYGLANNAGVAGGFGPVMLGGKSTSGAPTAVSVSGTTAFYYEAAVTVATTAPTHFVCNQYTIFGLN